VGFRFCTPVKYYGGTEIINNGLLFASHFAFGGWNHRVSRSKKRARQPESQFSTERPKLLRYREVAVQLGVSLSFVKQHVLAGRIASVTLGTARRVTQAEVDRIVRQGIAA
jgi:excisionase family DNA binding protein